MLDPENMGDDQPRKRIPQEAVTTHILNLSSQKGVVNPRGNQGAWQAEPTHRLRGGGGGRALDGLSRVPGAWAVPGGCVHTYPQLFTAMRSPTSRKG